MCKGVSRIIPVDHEIVFVRFEEVWYRLRWTKFPPKDAFKPAMATVHDALLNRPVTRGEAFQAYQRSVLAAEARRATREEIRRWCEPLRAPNIVR